ncbi:uncharacterized protein [Drosophila tropicalis]|uniref:uncharacterized protein n=1 Tax=Drosophila tropicalis TaxID=46794 RepID=UPI0035ABBF00
MASIVDAPQVSMGEPLPIWLKIDWPPEVQHDIFRDWGTYYSRRRRENFAMHYYDKALNLDPKDHMTLYRRCQSKRKAAQIEGALQDCMEAATIAEKVRGRDASINLEICDVLYELNQFEKSKVNIHDNIRQFKGNKTKNFEQRLIVVDDVINDVTGDALTNFFSKHSKIVDRVNDIRKAKEIMDYRPMWKILREQQKCDVVSIPDVQELLLSPLEIARRRRAFNVFHQAYINDSWIDVLFMKDLRKNSSLFMPQCKNSFGFLATLSSKQYDIVRKFMKMLQSRSPLYYVNYVKYRNKKLLESNREAYLFRVQYQTRRNMIAALRTIRQLRKDRKVPQLTKYVEALMGDYVVIKTHRVMCWKFEFINEVYNTLALALVEQFVVPKNLNPADPTTLLKLLHMPTDKLKDFVSFVFGDRSTHQEPDLHDPATVNARKLIARLEKRMMFAKYAIEKCYLHYLLAQTHLQQDHHDECAFSARKGIKESRSCNSNIWKFLNLVQIIKTNASLHKLERTREALEEALPVARDLKSPELVMFIETCMFCNEETVIVKGSVHSRRGSKQSDFSSEHRASSNY